MNKKRIEMYDVSKGILMSMVVLGHIITMNYNTSAFIKTFIYTFHVPAFFIITGILTKETIIQEYEFINYLKKKVKQLLIPYFLFEILAAISQMIFLGFDYLNVKGAFINIILLYCNGGATWFLPTLFITEIIYYGILLVKEKYGEFVVRFLIIICLGISFILPQTHLFIIISRCLLGIVFVYMGMFLVKKFIFKNISNSNKSFKICFTSFMVTIIIAIINGKVGMNLCEFNNPILYVLGSLTGTCFILFLSNFIHSKILIYIGENSLVILGTHLNIIVIIEKLLNIKELYLNLWIPVFIIIVILEFLFINSYNKLIKNN